MKVLLCLLLCLPLPAEAGCRLALALAMDVSRSVDGADFVIQTEGLALALEDAAVRDAFFAPAGAVALAVYQWSGESYQEVLVDWVLVERVDDLDRVAALVRAAQRPERRQLTALGEALSFGHALLARAPDCGRRVIDVAGDGQNNQGRTPARVYAAKDWAGITVNALAIQAHEMGLTAYFHDALIRGPGAFVEVAHSQYDFPPAIRRKLIRELTEALAGLPAPPPGQRS
ncbi:MAG: DUF1194 domain-containing protein [Paracoccaceae bacterium]